MTNNFKLLDVSFNADAQGKLFPKSSPLQAVKHIEFSPSDKSTSPSSWVTVLLGKNGVGKSRFLSQLAEIFELTKRGLNRARRDYDQFNIRYSCDGDIFEFGSSTSKRYSISLNGEPCPSSLIQYPTKVIALTTTPFDKFRITNWRTDTSRSYGTDRYVYLGLRDGTGRASSTAAIAKAVEGLFGATRREFYRRSRTADVFNFLGYKPRIDVIYELKSGHKKTLEAIVAGKPLDSESERDAFNALLSMTSDLPGDTESAIKTCRDILDRLSSENIIKVCADFESGDDDLEFFHRTHALRSARFLTMRSVFLQRLKDGASVDLRQASSGELGIVIGFLGLASVIEDGSLILIDEPEISLHPEWQAGYINLLLKTFGSFKGCHYILATHSPLILSDIDPEISNVVLLDTNESGDISPEIIAGRSSDYLLATTFKTPGNNNLFLKQEIVKALRLAANGEADSTEFSDLVGWLVDLLPKLGEDSSIAALIKDLQAAAEASESNK